MRTVKEIIQYDVLPLDCVFSQLSLGRRKELMLSILNDEFGKPRRGDMWEFISEAIDDDAMLLLVRAIECGTWSAFCSHFESKLVDAVENHADELIESYREPTRGPVFVSPVDREHWEADNRERARDIKGGPRW